MKSFVPDQSLHIMADFCGLQNRQECFCGIVTTFDVEGGKLSHYRFEQVLIFGIQFGIFIVQHIRGYRDFLRGPGIFFLVLGHFPSPRIGKRFEVVIIART